MSRDARERLEQCEDPSDEGRSITVWPWPRSARGLLALLVLIAGLSLRLAGQSLGSGPQRSYRLAPVLVIDPNTAPAGVLEALPHVGPALLKKIVEQREISPFRSIADLRRRVRGLGPATLARLASHLRIDPDAEPIPDSGDLKSFSAPGEQRLAQGPRPPAPR